MSSAVTFLQQDCRAFNTLLGLLAAPSSNIIAEEAAPLAQAGFAIVKPIIQEAEITASKMVAKNTAAVVEGIAEETAPLAQAELSALKPIIQQAEVATSKMLAKETAAVLGGVATRAFMGLNVALQVKDIFDLLQEIDSVHPANQLIRKCISLLEEKIRWARRLIDEVTAILRAYQQAAESEANASQNHCKTQSTANASNAKQSEVNAAQGANQDAAEAVDDVTQDHRTTQSLVNTDNAVEREIHAALRTNQNPPAKQLKIRGRPKIIDKKIHKRALRETYRFIQSLFQEEADSEASGDEDTRRRPNRHTNENQLSEAEAKYLIERLQKLVQKIESLTQDERNSTETLRKLMDKFIKILKKMRGAGFSTSINPKTRNLGISIKIDESIFLHEISRDGFHLRDLDTANMGNVFFRVDIGRDSEHVVCREGGTVYLIRAVGEENQHIVYVGLTRRTIHERVCREHMRGIARVSRINSSGRRSSSVNTNVLRTNSRFHSTVARAASESNLCRVDQLGEFLEVFCMRLRTQDYAELRFWEIIWQWFFATRIQDGGCNQR